MLLLHFSFSTISSIYVTCVLTLKPTCGYFARARSPITIMRNELISQGGSGVPINRDAYMKSVDYWKDHAVVM